MIFRTQHQEDGTAFVEQTSDPGRSITRKSGEEPRLAPQDSNTIKHGFKRLVYSYMYHTLPGQNSLLIVYLFLQ